MPFDKQIMKACLEAGGHNILHMCKTDVNFDRYKSYKAFIPLPTGACMSRFKPGGGTQDIYGLCNHGRALQPYGAVD